MKIVVKSGGAALEDKETLKKCAQAVVQLAQDGHQVAVVHGGGSALTRTLKLLGKTSDFVHGLRVTDAETRDVALMVLAGIVNKSLVAAIAAAGCPAIGLCGGDGGVFFATGRKNALNMAGYISGNAAFPSRAGSEPFGRKVEFLCSPQLRSEVTGS